MPGDELGDSVTPQPTGDAGRLRGESARLGRPTGFDALQGGVPLGKLGITSHQGTRAAPKAW